jgi:hypothetical protein
MPVPSDGLEKKIREGLLRYAKESGSPDVLIVPNNVYPLLQVGVPYAAAVILVERAANSTWIISPEIETYFQPSPLQRILSRTGGLVIRKSNIEDAPGKLGILQRIVLKAGTKERTLFLSSEFTSSYDAYAEQVKRATGTFSKTEDSPENLTYAGEVLDRVSAKATELQGPDSQLLLFFSSEKQPVVVSLSDREHSMFSAGGASTRGFDYRTLAGSLSFSRLPDVLARLVRRNQPKRQHRLARMNPMTMPIENLKTILSAPGAQPIAVPGKPGRVYVYSKKRDAVIETSAKRAAAWAIIAKTAAENKEQQSADAKAAAQELGIAKPLTAQENPMSDDAYFLDQYSKEPYGARQSIPAARRNPRKKAKSEAQIRSQALGAAVLRRAMEIINSGECSLGAALKQAWDETHGKTNPRRKAVKKLSEKQKAAQAHARAVLKRAHEIYASKGCSVKKAVDQAWAEIRPRAAEIMAAAPMPRRGRRAAAASKNPVDYRDPSIVYSALDVPTDYRDPSVVRTALQNPGVQYTSKGQPYIYKDGRPRFISKAAAARMNPAGAPDMTTDYQRAMTSDYSTHHPIYEQWIGQFSTSEPFTAGFQPMNRRNPAMTARFPSKCAACGGEIERGEHIKDSGKRGPKGGKLMAHINCGY